MKPDPEVMRLPVNRAERRALRRKDAGYSAFRRASRPLRRAFCDWQGGQRTLHGMPGR